MFKVVNVQNGDKMKKFIGVFATVLLSATLLTGCGGSDNTSEISSEISSESSTESSIESSSSDTTSETEKQYLADMKVEDYVTLGEYKGIAVSVAGVTVDDATWDSMVDQLYSGSMTQEYATTDRAVETGDTVDIDYAGTKDGVAFDGGTATAQKLTIGSGSFIDGFEDGLVGVMPGETVELNLTFPETYSSTELAGQEVVFTVTVNYIVPEMTDEIVAGITDSEFSTVEDMRQYVYDYLYSTNESTYTTEVENAILEAFISSCTFTEFPETMISQYRENIRASIEATATSYGMDAETYIYSYYYMDLETFLDTYSVESVKQSVALQAVANLEGLNVTDDELQTKLDEYVSLGGYTSVEEMLGENSKEDYREYFMFDKVYDFLVENAVVSEP